MGHASYLQRSLRGGPVDVLDVVVDVVVVVVSERLVHVDLLSHVVGGVQRRAKVLLPVPGRVGKVSEGMVAKLGFQPLNHIISNTLN